ncbi:MAG: hypothetical protein SH847_20110 [Roseiflexaceae bacterium]|nr:hypothetical protein [Roseiflexaceae bacterium]
MSSRSFDPMRGQRRRAPMQITSKSLLALLAIVAMGGSAAYWWGVQSALTDNRIVAAAYTAILVLAPPSLVSFLIPWSPAGMLLQKVNMRTIGYTVVIICALYLLYYSYWIQTSWWAAQPVVADANLVSQQMLIGMIGFIIIPALLWTPVSSDELVEQVRQAHLVKRYELQTQADIAILRATLLRAQQLSLKGFANLSILERQELAGAMNGLVSSVDKTLREVGETVKTVSGVAMPFDGMLDDNEDIRGVLDYISDSLSNTEFDQNDQQLEVESRTRELALQNQLLAQPVRETRQMRADRNSYDYDDQLRSLEQDPRQTQRSRASSRSRNRR